MATNGNAGAGRKAPFLDGHKKTPARLHAAGVD
jgi:hypothetical protein